ncbi:MAG: ATP-binding protein [Chloroflexi bacterium]|nr:ATP-binding protein [Chloroflexota bacterium]
MLHTPGASAAVGSGDCAARLDAAGQLIILPPRPNVFKLYEENIGPLTGLIGEELVALSDDFSEIWLREAIQIAVEREKRNLAYVRGCCGAGARRESGVRRINDLLSGMGAPQPENMPNTSSADPAAGRPVRAVRRGRRDLPWPGRHSLRRPDGRPALGQAAPLSKFPVERDVERQNRLRALSNLDALTGKTFATFQTELPMHTPAERGSLAMALSVARSFADNPAGKWILLQGPYGCGKTHLAAAIGLQRLQHGDVVLFITTPDLLDHLRISYGEDAEGGYDETFDRIRGCDLLILDDLGVENPSRVGEGKAVPASESPLYAPPSYGHHHQRRTRTARPAYRSRLHDVDHASRVIIDAPDYRNTDVDQRDHLSSSLSLYRDQTFETFDAKSGLSVEEQRNLVNVANAAVAYAQNPNGRWLVLAGGPGTGKTHLAAAIGHHREQLRDDVFFITVPDLLDDLRTTFSPGAASTFDQRFNKVKNVGLLILDDLSGTGHTEWAREKLFQPSTIGTSNAFQRSSRWGISSASANACKSACWMNGCARASR